LKERSQTVLPVTPRKSFKANPMPDFSRVSILSLGPVCSAKALTVQHPFSLNTDSRARGRPSVREHEEPHQTFKAREAPRFSRPVTLTPQKSRQTIAVTPQLASDLRAGQRAGLIEKTRSKIEMTKEQFQHFRKARAEQENLDLEEYRRDNQFRATPVRHYRAVSPC
jgi:hypothetical protein